MKIRSLGYRTDLIFPAFEGEIIDRGHYVVVRTPSNPTFYWGNFLLFARPPQEGDFQTWRNLFAREIGAPPEVEHQAFGWDSPDGGHGFLEPFIQAGFEANHDVVLAADAPHAPPRPSQSVSIRALASDAEWLQAIDLQVTCRDAAHKMPGYREFRERSMERYRKMSVKGLGFWYGAFIADRLVADLGIFRDKDLGRYQSVETHPDFRRQGIAGTMIYEAGRHAMTRYGLRQLVMIAEQDSDPARLYQSLGFAPLERSEGLLWFPHAQQPGRHG
jgi:ribosomal protein S18 acetylase RimI-like enzyme